MKIIGKRYAVDYAMPTSENANKAKPEQQDETGGAWEVKTVEGISFFPSKLDALKEGKRLKSLGYTPVFNSIGTYKSPFPGQEDLETERIVKEINY